MATSARTFTDLILSQWRDPSLSSEATLAVSGGDLTIADVVAVSRHLAHVELTPASIAAIEACSKIISEKIAQGEVIYGVNTGFGGSADARSDDVERVQQSLISHLTCGIVSDGAQRPALDRNGSWTQSHGESDPSNGGPNGRQKQQRASVPKPLPLNDPLAATCMPESWARASMLIRLNSLAGGASGIRVNIAESLVHLLNKDVVPRIPVRGSISASGDLSALAWIAALMQGKSSATALSGPQDSEGARRVTRADVALAEAGISPVSLGAKEGLAIVNGTAVSAGVAALAAHECLHLAALSQVLTAMSVEALRGSDESFEPFIARVRPHPGQADSARNIKAFLAGSRLLNRHDSRDAATLRQDRYSLRTASQWIGPVLEDFGLAYNQLTVELNSVTDNPLVDAETGRVLHGGNFQARAVTSAAEKLRQGLQSIGRMLFAQCTEMINPATSWGLPPNLCSDDASDSFLFKGLDVVVAALTSELGFLANPVGSHVQTAEMGNQALNSLALVSARYTLEAADVLSQIASAHLLALCQALDLRAVEIVGRDRQDAPPDATPYIGQASRRVYRFLRQDLGIPFLGEAHLASAEAATTDGVTPSMGLYNTRVYESIRSGRLYAVVLECLQEVEAQRATNGKHM
ncbi:phenylalanine ammonia-lyase [Colletotrichum falcatum]|nr:phenylalanine ammonia-lyase [Colletotrichum falcatum]